MDLLPLLNNTAGSVDALKAKAEELGLIMSDDAVNAAGRLHGFRGHHERSLSAAGYLITSEFMPSLTAVVDGFTQLVSGKLAAWSLLHCGRRADCDITGKLPACSRPVRSRTDARGRHGEEPARRHQEALVGAPGRAQERIGFRPSDGAALFEIASSLVSI
jgi:hypothetical protein